MGKPKVKINTGDRFGKLTIIKEIEGHRYPNGSMDRQFLCKCDCGNETIARRSTLTRHRLSSCGCEIGKGQVTHNLSRSRLYSIWKAMRRRCYKKNDMNFCNYGGRGIMVCEAWSKFEPFAEWALSNGYSENLEIDRIDVNGNYEPSNCRWATRQEQCLNKRDSRNLTINGVTKHLTEWSKETGISAYTIWKRFKKYGACELILSKDIIRHTEIKKNEIIELYNSGLNYNQISKRLGITPTAINKSLKKWNII